jgi:DNA mismatch repair protein MutL
MTAANTPQRQMPTVNDPTAIPEGMGKPQKPRTLPILRVVGQVGATYIVAEGPSGMYLIDQHAAHERILYEQFMDDYQRQHPMTQYALETQTITLPPDLAQLVEEYAQPLQKIGFALESFGPNTYVIRGIPAILTDSSPIDALQAILLDLEAGVKPAAKTIEDKIVTRICKQVAVKAGQILSHDEMQSLINQLERCSLPHSCPHGRPTMLHMTSEHIAREFGRLG